MAFVAQSSLPGVITLVSISFVIVVGLGIGVAVILSLIPTYLSTHNISPSGEQYCISNLLLNITFTTNTSAGLLSTLTANASYSLSLACYRILQSYKTDGQLAACLLSNCSLTANVSAVTNGISSPNISCYAVIYYSTRCPDEAPTSGLNIGLNTTTNSACRKRRLTNIDGALGQSNVLYTNVPSLTVSNIVIPIITIATLPVSSYSQVGAYYCGLINQTAISSIVYAQANG